MSEHETSEDVLANLLRHNVLTPYYWFMVETLSDDQLRELLSQETRPEFHKVIMQVLERREKRNAG